MEEKSKIYSKSNIIKFCISLIIIAFVIFIVTSYLINDEFRNIVDTKILNKDISESSLPTIEINSDGVPNIYAYGEYILVLDKNILTFYNKEAIEYNEINVNIITPCFYSNDKYFVLAEEGGTKLYLMNNSGIQWEKDIDGKIYRVSVNQNGYVTVLSKNNIYQSIIIVYDTSGEELFKAYLKTSYAICSEISNDNKYLAIGQIDYSGTIIKSIVNLISIDAAKGNSSDSTLYTYESESGVILTNIKFNSKNEVICMFDAYIQKITELSDERLYDIDDDIFVDINLENSIIVVEKEASGLFSYEYQVNIKSTVGKSDNLYMLENGAPKDLFVVNDLICINSTNEIKIINSSGWLLKHYTVNNEIQNIVIGDSIIGIVYNNKIEIINI